MKSSFLLFFFALFVLNPLFSQNATHKVTYHCTTNIAKGKVHDGLNTLYFAADKGLFIHNNYPKEDKSEWHSETSLHYVKGDPEGLPVFVDLKEQYMVYKSTYSTTKKVFIFEEEVPKIDWKIDKETKTIGNFTCIKATGVFGGREYVVWFTPDIPIALGPYKLGGLPGLILEAKSTDDKVAYEFNTYESKIEETVTLAKPTDGQEVTWDKFKEFVINKLIRAEALSTSEYTITNNDPSPNWEIEKNKFTIISEYKKERGF